MEELQGDTLDQEVHHALQHLYNPTELRKCRLLSLLGVAEGPSPLTQLRRTLADAIEALKPEDHVPPEAQAWRIYNILTYRYVERLSQREAAGDLCLSVRQLRRDEHAAIRVLIHHLRHSYQVAPEDVSGNVQGDAIESASDPTAPALSDRAKELDWLRQTLPNETMDILAVVEAAVKTATPLIQTSRVTVKVNVPADLPCAVGQAATARQALLNILSVTAPAVTGGCIELTATANARNIELILCPKNEAGKPLTVTRQLADTLAISKQLVELGRGTLRGPGHNKPCVVTLVFPAATAKRITVLVIDDNADTLQLFQRYTAGTRFDLVPVAVPEEALVRAQDVEPDVIVLDVMLPNIDGWELLGRIREHPATRDVPVVMCTILPQEKLALALGADAFLQKPFSRESLFEVLAALVDPHDQEDS